MKERERRLARIFRADSLKSLTQIEKETGIDRATLANFESGRKTPAPHHLELLAHCAGLTVQAGEQILDLIDTLREPRQRPGPAICAIEFFTGPNGEHTRRVWHRFLRLRPIDPPY